VSAVPAADPSSVVMTPCVVVITGGAPLHDAAVAAIPPGAVVIAADGALDHALAAGIEPAGLVGDLDSVSEAGLAWARAHSTIERYDPDKDHTDTELALRVATDLNPDRLLMIGAGDRLDHQLAAIGALGRLRLTSVPLIEGWWGPNRLRVVHGPGQASFELPLGTTLSLLAMHGPCTGVHISGVRWPLVNAELEALVGHGVSNESTAERVTVRVSSGVLTIVIAPIEPDRSAGADRPARRTRTAAKGAAR
jgi:thiamine pyrophosphokinase